MAKRITLRIPWNLLVTLVAYYLFSEMYVKLVVPTFNWGGMTYDPRDNGIVELALLVFTSLLLPNKVKNPCDLYNWLYFVILLIPSAVLSAEQGSNRFHLLLMFAALWLLMLFRRIFAGVFYRRIIAHPMNYRHLPYQSVFLYILGVLIFLAVSVHGAFNLNFYKVYEFRFDISENMPLVFQYMLPLAAITLIGYLAALTYHRKNTKILFLIAVIGILFFGFSSNKSMLFYPLVAMAGYFLFKMSRPHLLILGGFSILAKITLLLPEGGSNLLGALFANRIVFIPSHINYFYFDFFSNNPKMLWAESKISLGLITSELPMGVMKYIGGLMTGNYDFSSNTGWVANAYMNAGIIGIVIYAAIIGYIFSLIDFWAKIYGKQLVGAAFLIPVITLIMSADLLIVLLTTGLIFLLMIFQVTTRGIFIHKNDGFRNERIGAPHNA